MAIGVGTHVDGYSVGCSPIARALVRRDLGSTTPTDSIADGVRTAGPGDEEALTVGGSGDGATVVTDRGAVGDWVAPVVGCRSGTAARL